ncbi:chaperone for protein-folding within the ER, fungal-domain-containing protein [Mycena leptocephala]|nr:chaperone for protein-folding within the ER, fungal-domain-containing protein [Mycena leptocephala]
MFSSVLALALAAAVSSVFAQDLYGPDHNTTSIVGTWSSGTQQVVPGGGFANPSQETFNYPKATGVGYSFSDDGWYEIARFRYVANGSHPECIIGTVIWVHGTYELFDNGSIICTPSATTELYTSWRIFTDVTFGPKLHLFQYDGSAVAPLFRLSDQPNMLPKQKLRNNQVQIVTTTSEGLVSTETIVSRKERRKHEGSQRRAWGGFWPWPW